MILQNHIPGNPKRDPLPLLLSTHLDPRRSRRRIFPRLASKRSPSENALPSVFPRSFHVFFPLDWSDVLHTGLGTAPYGLIEGQEEGVIMLTRLGLGRKESVEKGEEMRFPGPWWTGDEDTLKI
jgi:hypothetical protein